MQTGQGLAWRRGPRVATGSPSSVLGPGLPGASPFYCRHDGTDSPGPQLCFSRTEGDLELWEPRTGVRAY